MSLDPLDTSPDARRFQAAVHSSLGPQGRLRAAFELSEAVREIRLQGLRLEHPDWSERELVARFILEAHGVRMEPSR